MKHLPLLIALFACSCGGSLPTVKDVGNLTNDAARALCEAFYAENPKAGFSARDLCAIRKNLDPFLREILAAKQSLKASLAAEE